MRYIELNPVRAGMVEHPRDYLWSSYHANADGEPDSLVTPHRLYRALGRTDEERRAGYRALFRSQLGEGALAAIREATNKGWALGNDRFREEIESLGGRRAMPLPKGRPSTRRAD